MSSTLPSTLNFLCLHDEVAQESSLQRRYNVFPLHAMFDADTILILPTQNPVYQTTI
jgi:hypothetical protein